MRFGSRANTIEIRGVRVSCMATTASARAMASDPKISSSNLSWCVRKDVRRDCTKRFHQRWDWSKLRKRTGMFSHNRSHCSREPASHHSRDLKWKMCGQRGKFVVGRAAENGAELKEDWASWNRKVGVFTRICYDAASLPSASSSSWRAKSSLLLSLSGN